MNSSSSSSSTNLKYRKGHSSSISSHDLHQQSHLTTTQQQQQQQQNHSLVNDPSYPSLDNIGTETNQLIRNELRRYSTKTDQMTLHRVQTSDERIDEIVRQSLPKGFHQLEDLEDFICIIQRRKISWSRIARWIIHTIERTWAIDLITLPFALQVVIPYWQDRQLFIDTFRDEFRELLSSILNDPIKCTEEAPSLFFASLIVKDVKHHPHNNHTNPNDNSNDWLSYLHTLRFTSKRSHQLTFIHKLLYQFSLADESHYGLELLSTVVIDSNNDAANNDDDDPTLLLLPLRFDKDDHPPMVSQSISSDMEFKLLNVINDPLTFQKAIDDRHIHHTTTSTSLIDDIAKSIISLISKPGYAKSLGEVCRCPKAQLVSKRVKDVLKENLLMLISHSQDCFARARVIEFLSYLLPASSEYSSTTREFLDQLGRSPPDKRISLWILLKYLDPSKEDAINAIKEELRRLNVGSGMKTLNLTPPNQVEHWSFTS